MVNMVQKAQKIFVEPDEEITFTIEKIRNIGVQRAILVVPHNAALVSSAVSLKILTRQTLSTDKLVVVVTDDSAGRRLSEKAGLIALGKISEVNKEVWQKVKELKVSQQNEKEKIKSELLGERTETVEKEVAGHKTVKASLEDEPGNKAEKNEEAEVVSEKPRLEPRVISISGINIVGGGDVGQMDELLYSERERLNMEPDASAYYQPGEIKKAEFKNQEGNIDELKQEAMEAKSGGNVTHIMPVKKSYVGRDLTKMLSPKEKIQSRLQNSNFKENMAGVLARAKAKLQPYLKDKSRTRAIQAVIVLVVLFFLYSYLVLPSVAITLLFEENQVRVNEQVTAAPDTEMDLANLKIPANLISKSATTSQDGPATGEGNKGDKAKGFVDIHNLKTQPLNLPAGTVLTNSSTGLKYTINSAVSIATFDGNISDQDVVEVDITAEKFGVNYNIINQTTIQNYKVGSMTTAEAIAKSYRDISGGTTVPTVVVSKEDLEALKASAVEELKTQLLENLKSLISDEDVLLAGSEQFKEDEFKSSVKENEEAENFSVDLKMTVSALTVLKKDLKAVAEQIVKSSGQGTEEVQISLTDPQIKNIKIANNVATFDLSSKADVTANIDEEELKGRVAGLSVSEARDILDKIDGVKEFKLKYTPSYIPFFLQKVPSDQSKIKIDKSVETSEQ